MVDKKHQWSREEKVIRLDSGHRRDLQAAQHITADAIHVEGEIPQGRFWGIGQESKILKLRDEKGVTRER